MLTKLSLYSELLSGVSFLASMERALSERDEVINCIIAIRRSCRRVADKKAGRLSNRFNALER